MENGDRLYIMLGEIRADVKNVIVKLSDQDDRLNHHSSRITQLEKISHKRAVLWGAALAAFPFIFTALGWYLTQ